MASRRIALASVAFVLGFSTVFIALGATASLIGQSLARYFDVLSIIAGVLILLMGLHFLGVFKFALLYREARVTVERKPAGMVGAYIMGLAFAFGWTPCVGPILAAILFMAAAKESAGQGALLLGLYALGHRDPFCRGRAVCQPIHPVFDPNQETYGCDRKSHGRTSRHHRDPVHDRSDVADRAMDA